MRACCSPATRRGVGGLAMTAMTARRGSASGPSFARARMRPKHATRGGSPNGPPHLRRAGRISARPRQRRWANHPGGGPTTPAGWLCAQRPLWRQRRKPRPLLRLRSSRSRASLTFSARPLSSCPLNCWIAFCASAFELISTNPKPRDWPLNLSVITATDSQTPACANNASRSLSVTSNARFPTYSFFPIMQLPVVGPGTTGLDESRVCRKHWNGRLAVQFTARQLPRRLNVGGGTLRTYGEKDLAPDSQLQ